MGKKIKFISFYFSALFFLILIGGCVTTSPSNVATSYYPNTIATTPVDKLVKVIIPETDRIVMIDGQKVTSANTTYVLPGNHTYTFEINYRSSTYCNGPSYGLKADTKKEFVVQDGEVSSVVTLEGTYEMDVSANEGQTVKFIFKPNPDCKAKIVDYFKVEVSN